MTALVASSDFVVLSMQRSGTTTMCNLINTLNESTCAYELLNFGPNNAGARWLAKIGQNDRPLTANEQLNFVKAVHAENRGTHFGFKIFPGHARNLTHLLMGLTTFKPIVHVRLDDLKHFKSIRRAHQTNCWGTTPDQQKDCKAWTFTRDPQAEMDFKLKKYGWYSYILRVAPNAILSTF
ncbi:MAG: hypothetical protein ACPGR8_10810 [Limisphaerales bacterium]